FRVQKFLNSSWETGSGRGRRSEKRFDLEEVYSANEIPDKRH
uniref:Uncharacterized protein n=1 Tax=Parascaris equorum TaxID=6256 RepID=A0A914S329_PAREQ